MRPRELEMLKKIFPHDMSMFT